MSDRSMASRKVGVNDNFCVRAEINDQYLDVVAAMQWQKPSRPLPWGHCGSYQEHGVLDNLQKIRSMGPADAFFGATSPAAIYAKANLDAEDTAAEVFAEAFGVAGWFSRRSAGRLSSGGHRPRGSI
jgi:hypothetical protein